MTIQIVGQASGKFTEVETNTLAMRSVVRPQDVLADNGSVFALGLAGTTTNILFLNLDYGQQVAIFKKLVVSAGNAGGTVLQATISATIGRLSVIPQAALTAGYLRNQSRLRGAMRDSCIAFDQTNSAPGSGVVFDSEPIASVSICSTAAGPSGIPYPGGFDLLDFLPDKYPLVLGAGDFLKISGGSTFTLAINAVWEERDNF